MSHFSRQSGFTLIEALVSVAIFAVVVSMAAVLFLATSNAQRKATNEEKVMREVRQTMEAMSRLIRLSSVQSDGGEQPILELTNNQDNISFWLDEKTQQIGYQRNGASDYFTSDDVQITNLQFFISPEDPDIKPAWPTRVTILLTAERAGEHGSADILKTQTTIVTRQY